MRKLLSLIVFMSISYGVSAQKSEEIRLLVRGDDIGSFTSANQACIDACLKGIVRSLEVMVPCAWFPEAAKLLNENPTIDVGVHLVLTSEWTNVKWRPLTFDPSLTDEFGYFYPYIWPNRNEPGRSIQEAKWKLTDIEAEFRAQIEMAKNCIPHITHISEHMGCAGWNDEVKAMVHQLAKEYNLYWGNPQTKPFPRMNATNRDSAEKRIAVFIEALDKLEQGNTYLFIEHPAYDTPEMQRVGHSGYENVAADRDGVTKIFTDKRVMDFIKKKDIHLIGYHDLIDDYQGFYVIDTKIYDGNGHVFTPYGVNTLFMYQDPGGVKTIPGIAKTSANCIRMFWQNDKNVPLSVLDDAIAKAVDNQLVVIVGLWEATGKWQNIDQCIDYWLRDDVKKMVEKYEKYFMLNIANEAGDKTISEADWENKYIDAVKKLRNAGYRVPIMIDPANWGRDERYIINCGEKILASDPLRNIIFSWHPWDIYQPASRYTNAFKSTLDKKLCMIVGEFSHLGANYEGTLDWKPLVEECNKFDIGWLWWSWCMTNDKHNIVNNFDFEQKTEWGAQVLTEMDKVAVKASIFN